MSDWTPRPPLFPAEWLESDGTVAPLTQQTLDYTLLAAEYGSAATYERYLEILAQAIMDGGHGGDDER